MKRHPMVVSYISALREKALVALGITNGARDMHSTPPAITTLASPVLTARAACTTASIPDPQRRLTVTPLTSTGNPASSAAIRATLRLSSPAWLAQPKMTSLTRLQSIEGLRWKSVLIGIAAVIGPNPGQGSAVASNRRPHRIADESFGHCSVLP
jgi:hypothetical protein